MHKHSHLLQLVKNRRDGAIGRDRQIFCNRDLNFSEIKWIGFDMDYTLAIYNRVPFDELAHKLTLERMVEDYRYPKAILKIPFKPHFAIRGLVIDRKLGNILKVDSFRFVGIAYHGLTKLSKEQQNIYRKNPPVMSKKRYRLIDTLFELPEAYLYAAMVDFIDKNDKRPDYMRLSSDLRASIDRIHAMSALKRAVNADLPRFIEQDHEITTMLHRLQVSGKKLFLMTNSHFDFTNKVMSYLLDKEDPIYPSWRDYFDVIVTASRKPAFFKQNVPFQILNEQGKVIGEEFVRFQKGVCYKAGNIRDFERMLGDSADGILYVGDHIYGDILRSKIDSHWRTCMIIPEMEDEMQRAREGTSLLEKIDQKEKKLQQIDDELQWDGQLLNDLLREREDAKESAEWPSNYQTAYIEVKDRVRLFREQRKQLLDEIFTLEQQCSQRFHQRWGSLFKEGNENAIFGEQVQRYACIYTSRASNFFHSSPSRYFRSPKTLLPHEKVSG